MTTPDLAAIRARADAATEGPWVAISDNGRTSGIAIIGAAVDRGTGRAIAVFAGVEGKRHQDAVFAAAAREDIPALLDHIDRLAAEVERLTNGSRPSDDQLIGGAAITSWLYVQASVESMERAMISAVKAKGAAILTEMERELRGPAPFEALIAAAKKEGMKTDAN